MCVCVCVCMRACMYMQLIIRVFGLVDWCQLMGIMSVSMLAFLL